MKKEQIFSLDIWQYCLLAARLLLAFTLASYGFAKLSENQFGITSEEMNLPVKDVSLFRLSWYLADHQPFKSFIGISQIITALLLIYNRTLLIGAFISLPIWINILIWDITFMGGISNPFTIRISYYLVLTFLILWSHKEKVKTSIRTIITPAAFPARFPVWAWILLPLAAIALEFAGSLPSAIRYLFK